jgi:hypothetical protein
MAGHWCMQCSARPADSNLLTHVNCAIWTSSWDAVRTQKEKRKSVARGKKNPWWPLIPLSNYPWFPFSTAKSG